ncbi:unnamed protein product [Closterium sp. Yama58-4]|nr:unnamed protein product [Closterium sp. Yama58-4]
MFPAPPPFPPPPPASAEESPRPPDAKRLRRWSASKTSADGATTSAATTPTAAAAPATAPAATAAGGAGETGKAAGTGVSAPVSAAAPGKAAEAGDGAAAAGKAGSGAGGGDGAAGARAVPGGGMARSSSDGKGGAVGAAAAAAGAAAGGNRIVKSLSGRGSGRLVGAGAREAAQEKEDAPPPVEAVTESLRIDNFVRPFTQQQVKDLLASNGRSLQHYWMDAIRTHCYVTFASVEEAKAARSEVWGLRFPLRGGNLLTARFVSKEERGMDPLDNASDPAIPARGSRPGSRGGSRPGSRPGSRSGSRAGSLSGSPRHSRSRSSVSIGSDSLGTPDGSPTSSSAAGAAHRAKFSPERRRGAIMVRDTSVTGISRPSSSASSRNARLDRPPPLVRPISDPETLDVDLQSPSSDDEIGDVDLIAYSSGPRPLQPTTSGIPSSPPPLLADPPIGADYFFGKPNSIGSGDGGSAAGGGGPKFPPLNGRGGRPIANKPTLVIPPVMIDGVTVPSPSPQEASPDPEDMAPSPAPLFHWPFATNMPIISPGFTHQSVQQQAPGSAGFTRGAATRADALAAAAAIVAGLGDDTIEGGGPIAAPPALPRTLSREMSRELSRGLSRSGGGGGGMGEMGGGLQRQLSRALSTELWDIPLSTVPSIFFSATPRRQAAPPPPVNIGATVAADSSKAQVSGALRGCRHYH